MQTGLLIVLGVLSLFGLVLLAMVVHEMVHVFQKGRAYGICYTPGSSALMFTMIDYSEFESLSAYDGYHQIREKWEKIAHLIFYGATAGLLGVWIGTTLESRRKDA